MELFILGYEVELTSSFLDSLQFVYSADNQTMFHDSKWSLSLPHCHTGIVVRLNSYMLTGIHENKNTSMVTGAHRPALVSADVHRRAMSGERFPEFCYDDNTAAMLFRIYSMLKSLREDSSPKKCALDRTLNKLLVVLAERYTGDVLLYYSSESDTDSNISWESQGGNRRRHKKSVPTDKVLEDAYTRQLCNRLENTSGQRAKEIKQSLKRKARKDAAFHSPMDWDFNSQSGSLPEGGTENMATSTQVDEGAVNTGFNSSVAGNAYISKTATDPLRMDGYTKNFDLSTFLQRPLQIFSADWDTADFLRASFNPWEQYLTHPSIVRKLDNYLYLRGSMKITLMLNGTQFHYGKGILSYNPLMSGNQPTRVPGSAPVLDNVTYSQRPHILFDPSDNVGGEMELPFMLDTTWLQLTDATQISQMGELTLSSFSQLGMANGETDSVRITIFAHFMPDVVLSGSTTQLVSQSGIVYESQSADEYGDGIISKPATALARWAGYLTNVPVIGPFALATQIGADAVGGIAKLFGYSRPVNVDPIRKYRPTYVGNIANTSIEEAVDKLTFDPKQETTIDPRITGFGQGGDDMIVNAIANRYSYLTSTPWTTSDTQGRHLASLRVTPSLFGSQTISLKPQCVMTPMCFAAQPFKYWRGSIKIRVQVVCSKFHKGRLRIVYDPKGQTLGSLDWIGGYNEVMDISEKTDMEFTITWNQPVAYKEVLDVINGSNIRAIQHNPADGDSPAVNPITNNDDFTNGVFAIYVQNDLVAPSPADTYSPRINIFVAAGDDFEVAAPDTVGMQTITYTSQSGAITDAQPADSAPLGHEIDSKDLGGTVEDMPGNSVVYFGETFHSFRDMLKRYSYSTTLLSPDIVDGSQSSHWMWRFYHKVFPEFRGGGTTVSTFTYSRNTLMNYLAPAYVAYRGGIRWKYVYSPCDSQFNRAVGRLQVSRYDSEPGIDDNNVFPMGSTGTGTNPALLIQDIVTLSEDTWSGAYTTPIGENPTVEVEIPYYSNLRFRRTNQFDSTSQPSSSVRGTMLIPGAGTNKPVAGSHAIDTFVAAGEDFNLIWFLSCPYMFAQTYPS
ncbi:MAG: structural protein [Cragig virus 8]|nr:MAG: structural protein [Cragig virus 8]